MFLIHVLYIMLHVFKTAVTIKPAVSEDTWIVTVGRL